jgi:hypothetical protein
MPDLGRRSLLRLLALAPFLRSAAHASRASGAKLSPLHRRLAEFGRRLSESDPDTADALHRLAARHASAIGMRHSADGGRIDALGADLLANARVAAELRRGFVHRIDGWVLSRSEASLCVYLHRLARRPRR